MGLTAVVLVLSTVLLIAYDIWVILKYGVEATISRVIYNASRRVPALAFAFGFLCGHLFWTNCG